MSMIAHYAFSVVAVLGIICVSCINMVAAEDVVDGFESQSFNGNDYRLKIPPNYKGKKRYPLVVWLHGFGGGKDNTVAVKGLPGIFKGDALQKKNPCFMYVPHTGGGWSSNMVLDTIEHLEKNYAIDGNRIYISGFSMGGSSSYNIAQAWIKRKRNFAAILRFAGGKFGAINHADMARSGVWIHIGDKDAGDRVASARKHYEELRAVHYPNAKQAAKYEKTAEITVGGATCIRKTLQKGKRIVAILSEYKNVGHEYGRPSQDPDIIDWLFAQTNRTSKKK